MTEPEKGKEKGKRKRCPDKDIDKVTAKTPSGIYTDDSSIISDTVCAQFVPEFADVPEPEELPNLDNDFLRAKAYLFRQSIETGDNLYDHLIELLQKILTERPRNIGDFFEEYSRKLKEARFHQKTDHLRDKYSVPGPYQLAKKLLLLFNVPPCAALEQPTAQNEEETVECENLMELQYYYEQAGIGLPRTEMFAVNMALRTLLKNEIVKSARFWGKILGLKRNYYIAEAELVEDELARINGEEEERIALLKEEKEKEKEEKLAHDQEEMERYTEEQKIREQELANERTEALSRAMWERAQAQGGEDTFFLEPKPFKPWPIIPPLPVPETLPEIPEVPKEPSGVGVNKKAYFIVNEVGDEWQILPDVTPKQITLARVIQKQMTGDLKTKIVSYPKFDGVEENYLRAQIARISAATHISPLGYYSREEGGEEEELITPKGGGGGDFHENAFYEGLTVQELTDPSMAYWVHHTPMILKQGTIVYWSPKTEIEGEGGEAEVDENFEIGPGLLVPLSGDVAPPNMTLWSTRSTSALMPEHSIAMVRSNLWQGAFAVAAGKKFGNLYVGFGHKSPSFNFSPIPMPGIQEEYLVGPEIMEISDPTPEEEEEWRKAHERVIPSGDDAGETHGESPPPPPPIASAPAKKK